MNYKKKIGLAIAVTALISAAAWARQEYSCTIVYYSDATYTEVVGTEEQTCSGNQPVQGISTPYAQETNVKSCGGSYICENANNVCF